MELSGDWPLVSRLPAEDPDIMDQGQIVPTLFCLIPDPQNLWGLHSD